MADTRRWVPEAIVGVCALVVCLLMGCSETVGPEDECVGWYQGFYVLATPDSLFLRAELDFTWTLPDSALMVAPRGVVRPSRAFERADPPGLAMVAAVDDVVGGWYMLRAFYGESERTYEEHLSVRSDVLNYEFSAIKPERGAEGVSLSPTLRWVPLPNTQARVKVYADSLREHGVFASGDIDDADSLRIPADVLEAGTRYYWTLEVYDWQSFLPECPAGYFYMDFFDNGILYVGWFTTTDEHSATL